jgi:CRISP-associated protein Cas1
MELHLQNYGARLRVKDGLYQVTVPDMSGANHHVVEEFATHQVKSILLQSGTSVSADALLLALKEDTDIVILDHFGNPEGRLYPNKPNSTIGLWKAQLLLSETDKGLQFARQWVAHKIQGRLDHLRKLKPYRNAEKCLIIEQAEQSIGNLFHKIKELPTNEPIKNAASLRGLEGTAGRIYFDTLNNLLPDDYKLNGRNFRPTEDIYNAFLNYGYGILYRKVEKVLHQVGLNPYIGMMHTDGFKRKSLVFDCIEAFRVWVDIEVFKLFTRKIAQPRHGFQKENNDLWLNNEGKQILNSALLERFKEKFEDKAGKVYHFDSYLLEFVRNFATKILKATEPTYIMTQN